MSNIFAVENVGYFLDTNKPLLDIFIDVLVLCHLVISFLAIEILEKILSVEFNVNRGVTLVEKVHSK